MSGTCWVAVATGRQLSIITTKHFYGSNNSRIIGVSRLILRRVNRMELRERSSTGRGFSPADEEELLEQVQRMCRLAPVDLDHVQRFWKKHPQAARARFGLLFRSPTLWEDIVRLPVLLSSVEAFRKKRPCRPVTLSGGVTGEWRRAAIEHCATRWEEFSPQVFCRRKVMRSKLQAVLSFCTCMLRHKPP